MRTKFKLHARHARKVCVVRVFESVCVCFTSIVGEGFPDETLFWEAQMYVSNSMRRSMSWVLKARTCNLLGVQVVLGEDLAGFQSSRKYIIMKLGYGYGW